MDEGLSESFRWAEHTTDHGESHSPHLSLGGKWVNTLSDCKITVMYEQCD